MESGKSAAAILIRPADAKDREWILPLSARLHDFGPPRWRPGDAMDAAVARAIGQALDSKGEDSAVFAAEDREGAPLGFIHVHTARDFFNVFGADTRARELYDRLGFAADTTKLVKVLET